MELRHVVKQSKVEGHKEERSRYDTFRCVTFVNVQNAMVHDIQWTFNMLWCMICSGHSIQNVVIILRTWYMYDNCRFICIVVVLVSALLDNVMCSLLNQPLYTKLLCVQTTNVIHQLVEGKILLVVNNGSIFALQDILYMRGISTRSQFWHLLKVPQLPCLQMTCMQFMTLAMIPLLLHLAHYVMIKIR